MKQYKLIAFDIDGTIMVANHVVCPKLKSTVAKLKLQGYIFTLATARTPKSALKIAIELGLEIEDIITLNGGLITNQANNVIYSNTFELDAIRESLDKLPIGISRNYYRNFEWFVEYGSEYTDKESSGTNTEYTKIKDNKNLTTLNKITLIGSNDLLVEAQKLLLLHESIFVGFSHVNYLEVMDKKISKYSALEEYARSRGIRTNEIIAFGDGENDIPMLQNVGLGIAMGNAANHVKAIAKDVTDSNVNAGVSNYLEKLIIQKIL